MKLYYAFQGEMRENCLMLLKLLYQLKTNMTLEFQNQPDCCKQRISIRDYSKKHCPL